MNKYIYVDAFEREMYHEAFETDTDMQRWDSGCWIRYKLFEEILKKQPTADVRENVYGEWIWSPVADDGTVSGCCNKCSFSHVFIGGHTAQYNFCPNCGADMRKKAEKY